ncbi:dephospho-CoA kinase [Amphibacillus cookii]|uniref:dephospho-CoA kinase n=1 Tax=Amphibacillus cookii TaxID=767787 RepID=UPI001956D946|nr:dephospho-CoA kinase [Amphibacillus cookii]MBM7541889.1 dephospho-CoA kinase [Amphibacillus cookii]
MTIVIGLTGCIATGKSTVAKMFKKEGIPIVDADQLSRTIVEPHQPAYIQIVEAFGHDILLPDQTLDRKKLAQLIFNDSVKRQTLNQIVHPAITDHLLHERDQLIVAQHQYIVLDIPLLYENDLTHLVDVVVVVYTTPKQQLQRLMARDQLSEKEANKRIQSQISIEQKAQWADYVIDNSKTLAHTETAFKQLLQQLEN